MIALDALYLQLHSGMDLYDYRRFMNQRWYHSLSRSSAIKKICVTQGDYGSKNTISTTSAAEFLVWAEDSEFWSEDEIGRLASLALVDMTRA